MEEKEYNVVTLGNGVEYTEVARLSHNNNVYIFLCDLESDDNFCIKKLVTKDGEDYITGLDNKDEFYNILNLFSNNYLN